MDYIYLFAPFICVELHDTRSPRQTRQTSAILSLYLLMDAIYTRVRGTVLAVVGPGTGMHDTS